MADSKTQPAGPRTLADTIASGGVLEQNKPVTPAGGVEPTYILAKSGNNDPDDDPT